MKRIILIGLWILGIIVITATAFDLTGIKPTDFKLDKMLSDTKEYIIYNLTTASATVQNPYKNIILVQPKKGSDIDNQDMLRIIQTHQKTVTPTTKPTATSIINPTG